MTTAPVFKETYAHYLEQIGTLDLTAGSGTLGYEMDAGRARIPCFDRTYWVDPAGIRDVDGKVPNLSICVFLSKYLLLCPPQIPDARELAAFKDFKHAAPLIDYFANSVQGEIQRRFQGDIRTLDRACRNLGGLPYEAELSYQVKYRFSALPRVPVYLFFNDAEEGFSAQCTLLFERSIASFLDMESVAMVGSMLAQLLKQQAP